MLGSVQVGCGFGELGLQGIQYVCHLGPDRVV
jgi:hypothetical protein